MTDYMNELRDRIGSIVPAGIIGRVVSTKGATIAVTGFPAPIGSVAQIDCKDRAPILAEVIDFRDNNTILYSYSDLTGISRGSTIRLVQTVPTIPVGDELLGRVVNAFGETIDSGCRPVLPQRMRYDQKPPDPCSRPPIDSILSTGIRAIDMMLTCGRGQRLGIFSGSGVGKSVTLGMMTRYTNADVIVIALIGERGREVSEFIQNELGEEGRRKCVVVVSTSNEPALMRVRAAQGAMSIAEYFRDSGKNVLFLMDSLTRLAMAQRELGLAAGEPATARGYTPSVFSMLPRFVERAGKSDRGSITAFFTVLVEGDDRQDPIGDAVRGLLDGHIWLSRKLSTAGYYPAIDIVESISRSMQNICSEEHLRHAAEARRMLGIYRDLEDMIDIGAWRPGVNSETDLAVAMKPKLDAFLQQARFEEAPFDDTAEAFAQLLNSAKTEDVSKNDFDNTIR